jgi:hypothetical protein
MYTFLWATHSEPFCCVVPVTKEVVPSVFIPPKPLGLLSEIRYIFCGCTFIRHYTVLMLRVGVLRATQTALF